jgi:hypothetical protein
MRTTIDIPDETYKNVKVLAAEQGSSFRQLVLDALDLLMLHRQSSPPAKRLRLPLIRSTEPGTLNIDNEKIYEIIDFP